LRGTEAGTFRKGEIPEAGGRGEEALLREPSFLGLRDGKRKGEKKKTRKAIVSGEDLKMGTCE